jgi:type III secretory pathway component EscS
MLLILGLSSAELMLIIFALGIGGIIGPILAIINIVKSRLESNIKIIWTLVSIFIPFGWIAYFIFGKRKIN